MANQIHSSAQVDPLAELGDDVGIGPFCVVGPQVRIGRGTRLMSHVSLAGSVRIGEDNRFGRFTAVGCVPQDASYRGTDTRVEIGDRNQVQGNVTISRGTEKEQGVTRIGSDNILKSGSHVLRRPSI